MNNTPSRNYALDLLRGLTIALMIIVNNPGNWKEMFSVLRHAEWHGFLGADIVFPLFLFVSGFAAALTLENKPLEGRIFYQRLLRRSAILFALGLFLNAWPFGLLPGTEFSLSHMRVFGVLQRIAICVLFGGIILRRFTSVRGLVSVFILIAAVYEICMRVPLVQTVDGVFGRSFALQDNFARFVDTSLLPSAMLYKVQKIPFDPEGLLTSLTAVMTFLLGGLAYRSREKRGLVIACLAALGFGLVFVEPINKNLWTLPYVFLTAAAGTMALAVLGKINSEGQGILHRVCVPFADMGRSPLLIYVLSGIVGKTLALWKLAAGFSLKQYVFGFLAPMPLSPPMSSLLYSILLLVLLKIVSQWLGKLPVLRRLTPRV